MTIILQGQTNDGPSWPSINESKRLSPMLTLEQIDLFSYKIIFADKDIGILTFDEEYKCMVDLYDETSVTVLSLIVAEAANMGGIRKYKDGKVVT